MKVNEPLIDNVEDASEACEIALDITEDQKSALDNLKDNVNSYISYEENKKKIKGEDFIQGYIENYDQEVEKDVVSEEISYLVSWFDEDKVFGMRKLGKLFDVIDSRILENRENFMENLNSLESFRNEIQDDYEPGSRHFPDDWKPSNSYIGTEDVKHRPDIELFQSNLSENNLRETSISERLEKLDETVDYLEELIDYTQEGINEDTVEANENFYEDIGDFTFPILNGLLESLRIARTEREGLEHFLIYSDEHDYLLQRWSKELEHDLFNSEWEIYGEEVEYFEDEPLTDKNQFLDSDDKEFWSDGEFDLLLKNGEEYAYVEVKSYDDAEHTAKEQLRRLEDYDSLLIKNNGDYERINTENVKKFWANQKPQFDTDYSQIIDNSSDEIVKLDQQ